MNRRGLLRSVVPLNLSAVAETMSDVELEAELERQCVEDGEALSDTLTMLATMNGVGTVDDADPEREPD